MPLLDPTFLLLGQIPAEIYLTRDGLQYGPYSPEELRAGIKAGTMSGNDYAWYEGIEEWVPINTIGL